MSRNTGRIIDLEKGSVRAYEPGFIKHILIKSQVKEKLSQYTDNDYYFIETDDNPEPYLSFKFDETKGDDELFDEIEETKNLDRILPYIKRNKKTTYIIKGVKREIKYEIHNNREIDFFYDCGEPYMKINTEVFKKKPNLQYAVFSQDDGHPFKDMNDEKSQPYVKFSNEVSIFYQPTQLSRFREKGAVNYIQKARDKVFALCVFHKIPIVIKITGTKLSPEYFINVWKSPFIRYPELSRIAKEFEFYYSTFDGLSGETEEEPSKSSKKSNKTNKKRRRTDDGDDDDNDNNDNEDNENKDNVIRLKYVRLPNLQQKLSSQSPGKIEINLPLTIIQKTIPIYPTYEQYSEDFPKDSLLPVQNRFCELLKNIRSEYEFDIKTNKGEAYNNNANVISFLELGYTPMNAYLPEMESKIKINTDKNLLSYLNRERNVSSIMEIASKTSKSIFLPSEPGSVQLLVGKSKLWHIAYYTRNKNSIMANANTIAAGLRESNYIIIPVTPSHVPNFLESLDCAFLNWKRFALSKYNIKYNQPKTETRLPKTHIIIYFEPGQRPFDAQIAIKNIKYHCAKYDDILEIQFARNQDEISKLISIDSNDDIYDINKLELLYSIAAFGTVNDCADYLELNDSYETKSSFAFE